MNKANSMSFLLIFFMSPITGLFFAASIIVLPIHAQSLSSDATSSPNATSSNTKSWIEDEINPLIGLIAGLLTGVVSIVTSMNLIERKNQQIGELGQEIKDLEKENEFVNALILHLVRQSKGMKDVVEKLSDHPDISTSVIY